MQALHDKIDLLSERIKTLSSESNAGTAHDLVLFDSLKNMLIGVNSPPQKELDDTNAAVDDMIAHIERMMQLVGTAPDLQTLRAMMTKQMELITNMQKAMYELIAASAFEDAMKQQNQNQ